MGKTCPQFLARPPEPSAWRADSKRRPDERLVLVPQEKPPDPHPALHAGGRRHAIVEATDVSRHERESFLGPDSESVLENVCAGIIGLGGGGSHIAQQLAHIGVGRFVLSDMDRYEDKNHNRTVGGMASDIDKRTPKVRIAERTILAINPQADVFAVEGRWQTALSGLREIGRASCRERV